MAAPAGPASSTPSSTAGEGDPAAPSSSITRTAVETFDAVRTAHGDLKSNVLAVVHAVSHLKVLALGLALPYFLRLLDALENRFTHFNLETGQGEGEELLQTGEFGRLTEVLDNTATIGKRDKIYSNIIRQILAVCQHPTQAGRAKPNGPAALIDCLRRIHQGEPGSNPQRLDNNLFLGWGVHGDVMHDAPGEDRPPGTREGMPSYVIHNVAKDLETAFSNMQFSTTAHLKQTFQALFNLHPGAARKVATALGLCQSDSAKEAHQAIIVNVYHIRHTLDEGSVEVSVCVCMVGGKKRACARVLCACHGCGCVVCTYINVCVYIYKCICVLCGAREVELHTQILALFTSNPSVHFFSYPSPSLLFLPKCNAVHTTHLVGSMTR